MVDKTPAMTTYGITFLLNIVSGCVFFANQNQIGAKEIETTTLINCIAYGDIPLIACLLRIEQQAKIKTQTYSAIIIF